MSDASLPVTLRRSLDVPRGGVAVPSRRSETAGLGRWPPGRWPDIALASCFGLLFLVQIARHALWRDELNAWGIALASTSPADLFAHMHYEGHPALWHLILWIAAHVSVAPVTIKVIQAVVGLGIIGMIAFRSPFRPLEKLLLLLSYFVLFEYTVMSRNYGIGVLLVLVFCDRRSARPDRLKTNALLLGLMANTNVFALALSGALALEYGWDRVAARRRSGQPWVASCLTPALIYAGFVLVSVATFWPAADISWRTTGRPLAEPMLMRLLTATIDQLSALVPIDVQAFWSPGWDLAPPDDSWARMMTLAAAPIVLLLVIRPFVGTPRVLIVPAVTFLGATALEFLVYGSIRHWGVNFVAFVAALWLARSRASALDIRWSLPILGFNAVAGIVFTLTHWALPFSNAGATAAWLQAHGYATAFIAGTPDTYVAAVAEELGRPAYFLDCRCTDSYLKFHNRRDDFRRRDLVPRLAAAPGPAAGQTGIFLDIRPLTAEQIADLGRQGLRVRLEGETSGAIQENFLIYTVERTAAGS